MRNFAVDPLGELVATIGCDGTLIVSQVKDEATIAKVPKVAKQTQLNSTQHLELAWSENGDYLYAAGDVSLSVFARRDLKTQRHARSVIHDKEISFV